MPLSGKRKAAMLLMSLDAETARQLLLDYPADVVHEIGMEMARLDAMGQRDGEDALKTVEEFCYSLAQQKEGLLHVKSFVNKMMEEMSSSEIQKKLRTNPGIEIDPFITICSSNSETIAKAIEYERPQIVAMIISSLPAKTGSEVMAYLDPDVSKEVACKMALPSEIAQKTRKRIAEMVARKIMELNTSEDSGAVNMEPTENLRKVAMVLSGLEQDQRDVLLDEISKKDEEIANTVKALMVTWEDIPRIYDRSLQEALRSVEPSTLAKALFGAESTIADKIRANISERAVEALNEEISLMQDPLKKEILVSREEVVKPLREANEVGGLRFIEN